MKVILTGNQVHNVKVSSPSSYKVLVTENAETVKVSLATTSN